MNETLNDDDECFSICQSIRNLSSRIDVVQSNQRLKRKNDKFLGSLQNFQTNLELLTSIITKSFEIISLFDFNDVRFNGFRSFFNIIIKSVGRISRNLQKLQSPISVNYEKYKLRCEDHMTFLAQLAVLATPLLDMMEARKDSGGLFIYKHDEEQLYLSTMATYDSLDSGAFYGQCLGFYLCKPCQNLAKIICSVQLGLGQSIYSPTSSGAINTVRILRQPRQHGSQIAHVFKQGTVKFCKQAWNLTDHPKAIRLSRVFLPRLKVTKKITLPPVNLQVPLNNEPETSVEVPCPADGVHIRLLSRVRRRGMEWLFKKIPNTYNKKPSKHLLVHCHGGGFVAQSSKSHDSYLRMWAIQINCTIITIDYSHAPEYPYPRAHEDCFYAYAWVLENLTKLGCSSDCRIIICGDSAGGNLALGCVLKMLQLNIRVPDAILLAYPVTLLTLVLSPGRMAWVWDPVLPINVLARCLLAYHGIDEDELKKQQGCESFMKSETVTENPIGRNKSKFAFLEHGLFDGAGDRVFYPNDSAISPTCLLNGVNLPNDSIMSPLLADDALFQKLPPLSVFACEFDPLLDDSIELCKKAHKAGAKKVRLQVMRDIPHGFLNMANPLTQQCSQATKVCTEEIKRLFSENDQ